MIEILKVEVLQKGYMQASLTVKFAQFQNLVITGVAVFEKDGKKWIGYPCYKVATEDKPKWLPYIKFESFDIDKKVKERILEAYEAYITKNKDKVTAERKELNRDQMELSGELPF